MLANVSRNLAKAARLAFGGELPQLRYELWNKWKGVDLEFVSVEDLGLPHDRAHFHSSSGGPALARVFGAIEIPAGSVAIDLGSGKGGAMCTLSRAGFAEVIGVELSGELIEIARRNAARLGCRNVRFIQADASTFSDYDRVTHVYMYNPFPCTVMTQAMAHLAASMRRAPRRVMIVYRNAECHDAIMASGLFDAEAERHHDQHAWRIYRSRRLAHHSAERRDGGN
jgi:protein-L-isoaspartate O-methyltransferase